MIDSVVKEDGRIKGFAVYPLYGDDYFKSIRMVMVGHELNSRIKDRIFLHKPSRSDSEFYEIKIKSIDNDGFLDMQEISDDVASKTFMNLSEYDKLPGDAGHMS